jgi:hypothetical protein
VHRVVVLEALTAEVDDSTYPVGIVEIDGKDHLVKGEDVELILGYQQADMQSTHPLGPPLEVGTGVALVRELLVKEGVPAVDTVTWCALDGPSVDELSVGVDDFVVEPHTGSQPADGRGVDLLCSNSANCYLELGVVQGVVGLYLIRRATGPAELTIASWLGVSLLGMDGPGRARASLIFCSATTLSICSCRCRGLSRLP